MEKTRSSVSWEARRGKTYFLPLKVAREVPRRGCFIFEPATTNGKSNGSSSSSNKDSSQDEEEQVKSRAIQTRRGFERESTDSGLVFGPLPHIKNFFLVWKSTNIIDLLLEPIFFFVTARVSVHLVCRLFVVLTVNRMCKARAKEGGKKIQRHVISPPFFCFCNR